MSVPGITKTSQYLSFKLDEEIYAMDINHVREVLDFTQMTKVPRMPDFMRGVINLRGGVVPVVDLRLKFGMPETEKKVDTCIVIIEVSLEGEETILGIMVDAVEEVMSLEPEQIEPAPESVRGSIRSLSRGWEKRTMSLSLFLKAERFFPLKNLPL